MAGEFILPEVASLAATRAQQAAAEQRTYSQCLTDLFQAEVTARQARYVVFHTQMAQLPFQKTLDSLASGWHMLRLLVPGGVIAVPFNLSRHESRRGGESPQSDVWHL